MITHGETLSELIDWWFEQSRGEPLGLGYPPKASGTGEAVPGKQWEGLDEIAESQLHTARLAAMDDAWAKLSAAESAALNIEHLNRTTAAVWRYPRATPEQYRELRGEGRRKLRRWLQAAGVQIVAGHESA